MKALRLLTLAPLLALAWLAPARAFTLTLNDGGWTLVNTDVIGGATSSPWNCDLEAGPFGGCLVDRTNTSVTIVGPEQVETGGGSTVFRWTNQAANNRWIKIQFDYRFFYLGEEAPADTATIATSQSPLSSVGPLSPAPGDPLPAFTSLSNVYLSPGASLSFTISTPATATPTALEISNFIGFEVVPTPVPAAGASAAFAFSRRLRRRLREPQRAGRRRGPAPRPHPSTYMGMELGASGGPLVGAFHYGAPRASLVTRL